MKIDTITAIATPPGRGGVGIVRVAGPLTTHIAENILGLVPKVRYAHFGAFYDNDNTIIDTGLALYFVAPNSFTGDDVLELHAHGSPIVLDQLVRRVIQCGARMARPGEFSERAFLNDKIDLVQAEAIADLINAASLQAARSATRSLQGEFSRKINTLVEVLTHLRMYVEAAIDFPEEEIDFLSDGKIATDLNLLNEKLQQVMLSAKQGQLLQEGMTVVIAGQPNAGKSSLLNALSGKDSAIVSSIAGTTRDVLREHIQIDGLPLHIIDTAGLRESDDEIEQEGIRRAWREIENADAILLVIDVSVAGESNLEHYTNLLRLNKPLIIVANKQDLIKKTIHVDNAITVEVSTKTGQGLAELKQILKSSVGFEEQQEDTFIARRRHLEALQLADAHLEQAIIQLVEYRAGELVAEELRLAQQALAEITGEFTSDDLLGKIFSSFCIGK